MSCEDCPLEPRCAAEDDIAVRMLQNSKDRLALEGIGVRGIEQYTEACMISDTPLALLQSTKNAITNIAEGDTARGLGRLGKAVVRYHKEATALAFTRRQCQDEVSTCPGKEEIRRFKWWGRVIRETCGSPTRVARFKRPM